jgi:hypothetical protein
MSEVLDRPEVRAPGMTPDAMIEKYVKLRDRKKAIEERHKQELAPFNDLMSRLEGWLLEALNAANLSSMRSPHGTAFKSDRTSAKVTDWQQTLAFIRANNAWDLLEARVSKNAALDIIKETKQPIPGVETSVEVVCNVRRAAGSSE